VNKKLVAFDTDIENKKLCMLLFSLKMDFKKCHTFIDTAL